MSKERPPFYEEQFRKDQIRFATRSALERMQILASGRSMEDVEAESQRVEETQPPRPDLRILVPFVNGRLIAQNPRMVEYRRRSQLAHARWGRKEGA